MKRDRKATPCMCLPLEWAPLFASLTDGKAGMLVKALMRHAEASANGGQSGHGGHSGPSSAKAAEGKQGAEGEAAAREVRDPAVGALLMVMIPQIEAGMAKQAARMEASRKAIIARGQTPRGMESANSGQGGQGGQGGQSGQGADGEADTEENGRESGGNATDVQRSCNERATNVQRACNERATNGQRTSSNVPPSLVPPCTPLSTQPLTPNGEERSVAPCATRTHAKKRLAHWIGYVIARLFRRRKSTAWAEKELAELRKVAGRPDAWSELREIVKAYTGGYEYRRHDIITLLRNWSAELDRAAAYNARKEIEDNGDGDDVAGRYFGKRI